MATRSTLGGPPRAANPNTPWDGYSTTGIARRRSARLQSNSTREKPTDCQPAKLHGKNDESGRTKRDMSPVANLGTSMAAQRKPVLRQGNVRRGQRGGKTTKPMLGGPCGRTDFSSQAFSHPEDVPLPYGPAPAAAPSVLEAKSTVDVRAKSAAPTSSLTLTPERPLA